MTESQLRADLAKAQGEYWIWSGEHLAWWRPNASGYTYKSAEAGRYTEAEAQAHLRTCGPEKKLVMQPAAQPCEAVEAGEKP